MQRKSRLSLIVLVLGIITCHVALGGGPLAFTGAGPVVWDTAAPIPYRIDLGPLRPPSPPDPGIDDATARDIVKSAFETWSNVSTAAIKFTFEKMLPEDVNSGSQYLNLRADQASGNFIVFDQQGRIIDAIYGQGNSDLILGFAAPLTVGGRITRFISLMNGKLAQSPAQFRPTLVHEFGHAVGLDHAQMQSGLANDGNPINDSAIPTMFPTSTDSERDNPPGIRPLHGDDLAWISFLYKNTRTQADFDANYSLIRGRVVREDNGQPVLGCNVVAIDQADTTNRNFSCVSDYLKNNSGEFCIPVPPGKYKLMIEPIRPKFFEGSSVGPYAESEDDVSFTTRVRVKLFPDEQQIDAGVQKPLVILKAEIQP